MGKKATIQFTDVPYTQDSFGLTMSGASASFEINGPWDSSYLIPGYTKEDATIGLYNYIIDNLPVGTDITVSKTSDTVNLFSESCTSVKFYNTTGGSTTQILAGNLNHNGLTTTYAVVSSQNWTSNYTVGSNIINLTWSGASDPEGSIKGYDLSYKIGTSNTWFTVPFIPTSDGGASYDVTITQQVTHVFRVRTVDTTNLVSDYVYFTQSITPIFQISSTSNLQSTSACPLANPNVTVYLTTATPSINTYVYNDVANTSPFNGTRTSVFSGAGSSPRSWKIGTPTNVYYSCTIDSTGKIINNPLLCTLTLAYNSGLISSKTNAALTACNYPVIINNNVYWAPTQTLIVGTILYTTTTLTTVVALGYYHIYSQDPITQLESEYIIRVGSAGNILERNTYSSFCANTGGGSTGGGGGGGGGCIDPLVSILLPNGITKIAAEIKVNDIILTVHEITKELGEFKVLSKKIITQPKVIVKFTDGTEIKVSDTHKFLMSDDTWKQIFMLKGNETVKGLENDKTIEEIIKIGEGDVVMFEIDDAHTYISDGLISHNLKEYLSVAMDADFPSAL
jgi:hypothetical protein